MTKSSWPIKSFTFSVFFFIAYIFIALTAGSGAELGYLHIMPFISVLFLTMAVWNSGWAFVVGGLGLLAAVFMFSMISFANQVAEGLGVFYLIPIGMLLFSVFLLYRGSVAGRKVSTQASSETVSDRDQKTT